MIRRIKKSIRAKFAMIFIGILCFACVSSFGIMHLFQMKFMKHIIRYYYKLYK